MKKIYKILATLSVLTFFMSFAVMAYAAVGCSDSVSYSSAKSTWPLVQCGNGGQHCCDFTEAAIMVNRILNWFIGLSVTIAAITFSIAGGNILLHPDDPGKLKEGKEMLNKTAVGLLIILGAWLVVHTLVSAVINPDTNALRFLK